MKNYVQPGNTVALSAPTGGVKSGDGFIVGALFGIAAHDAEEGVDVETALVGVFDLPKTAGSTIAQGAKVYWISDSKAVTGTASGNTLIGVAIIAAGTGDTTARVRLNAF